MRRLTKQSFKLHYNSPVILTFSLLAILIFLINLVVPFFTFRYFSVGSSMSLLNPIDYWRLVSHVLGHGSWGHLVGNLSYILLLGPILEEKYGSQNMFWMIFLTALFTGIINVLFFSQGLLGASGIVFMFIILVSIVDIEEGKIPLTFLLVALIFVGRELINIFQPDGTSQIAHIIGGIAGGFFGFMLAPRRRS
ncbi:MAG: rhomboid family intramembrane serine protease [Deinococcales bacterium]